MDVTWESFDYTYEEAKECNEASTEDVIDILEKYLIEAYQMYRIKEEIVNIKENFI